MCHLFLANNRWTVDAMRQPLALIRSIADGLFASGMSGAKAGGVCLCLLFQLVSSSAPALAQQACDRLDVQQATTPVPSQFDFAIRRHEELAASSAHTRADVVAIGDSLIEQWPQSMLLDVFPNQRIVNLGVGGDKTQHVLWRLRSNAFDDLRPRSVVVLIGSANLSGNQSACAIVSGVAAVVSDIRQRWNPKDIILIEILPRCKDPSPKLDERMQINAMFRARFRSEPGIKLVNADDALTCNVEGQSPVYNDDYIHLNSTGYRVLSEQLKSVVR
jgi:lysophospholipase L1-like esterase